MKCHVNMNHLRAVTVILCVVVPSAMAENDAVPAATETVTHGAGSNVALPAGAVSPSTAVRAALASMHVEIRARLEQERQAVAELQAQLVQTLDPVTAVDLQRQVAAAKKKAQVDILRIQLRHAEEAGATAAVAALQTAVQALVAPPALDGTPTPRPGAAQAGSSTSRP